MISTRTYPTTNKIQSTYSHKYTHAHAARHTITHNALCRDGWLWSMALSAEDGKNSQPSRMTRKIILERPPPQRIVNTSSRSPLIVDLFPIFRTSTPCAACHYYRCWLHYCLLAWLAAWWCLPSFIHTHSRSLLYYVLLLRTTIHLLAKKTRERVNVCGIHTCFGPAPL